MQNIKIKIKIPLHFEQKKGNLNYNAYTFVRSDEQTDQLQENNTLQADFPFPFQVWEKPFSFMLNRVPILMRMLLHFYHTATHVPCFPVYKAHFPAFSAFFYQRLTM
jgi:hypothetical protein